MPYKQPKTTFGEPLYTLKSLADVSNTSVLTLKQWFDDGELKRFMTVYEGKNGRRYYRWGAPLHWETPIKDHIYDLETVIDRKNKPSTTHS